MANMEYGFLYDKGSRLLSIGYNLDERRRDTSYYDLLASEVRLSVFVAIAQGQLPQESWFALGRLLTAAGGKPILLSWSGSMSEYLMPPLVMPTYDHTLLDETTRGAVARWRGRSSTAIGWACPGGREQVVEITVAAQDHTEVQT